MSITDDDERMQSLTKDINTEAKALALKLVQEDKLSAYPIALAASVLVGLQLGLSPQLMQECVLKVCEDYETALSWVKKELN